MDAKGVPETVAVEGAVGDTVPLPVRVTVVVAETDMLALMHALPLPEGVPVAHKLLLGDSVAFAVPEGGGVRESTPEGEDEEERDADGEPESEVVALTESDASGDKVGEVLALGHELPEPEDVTVAQEVED